MSRLGTQSEIDKLGATLALETEQLAFLSEIAPDELRNLRIAIYERMFDQDSVLFERLATLGSRLPAAATARIAERAFGPLISARVVAEMAPEPALAIARRVSVAFFADTAPYLDPRRLRDMIVQLPIELAVSIARELVARGEFMTISRFVDFVSDEQTEAVVAAIDDEAAILRVAFYMGSKNRMDHLFRTLPDQRIARLVERVQERPADLLEPFLSVLIHVSYGLRREVGDVIAGLPEPVLDGYIRAVHNQGLWADVLPVVGGLSPAATRTIVNLPVLSEPDVQRSVVEVADAKLMWGTMLPLVALMDETNRDAVAAIVATLDVGALERASDAALMGEYWDTLLALVARMPAVKHEQLAAIVGKLAPVDPELVERIERRAQELGVQLTSESRSGPSTSSA